MNEDALKSTTPKPFVFVLMPFDEAFNDIFKFGIMGAAEDVGAHAERLDKQIFTEGMLDHIFNEISKADVIVADMTGRNPNVFYEVGYAHALGKIVLLLTNDSDDIPFDLKHRQHTVYGGSIEKLKDDLAVKLEWAIATAATTREGLDQTVAEEGYFDVEINGTLVYPSGIGVTGPVIVLNLIEASQGVDDLWSLKAELRNSKARTSPPVESVYLFYGEDSLLRPLSVNTENVEDEAAADGLTRSRKLSWDIPPLPKKATHVKFVAFSDPGLPAQEHIRIRFVFPDRYLDYPIIIENGITE